MGTIATLKSNVTSYTDQRPVSNNTNTYTVRAYYSPTKTLADTIQPVALFLFQDRSQNQDIPMI